MAELGWSPEAPQDGEIVEKVTPVEVVNPEHDRKRGIPHTPA